MVVVRCGNELGYLPGILATPLLAELTLDPTLVTAFTALHPDGSYLCWGGPANNGLIAINFFLKFSWSHAFRPR